MTTEQFKIAIMAEVKAAYQQGSVDAINGLIEGFADIRTKHGRQSMTIDEILGALDVAKNVNAET